MNEQKLLSNDVRTIQNDGVIVALPYLMLAIGILSPYREQVNHLEALFREDALLAPLLSARTVDINTIDGFQGQERDVIYISLLRSNDKHEIGFLQDYRRMNVAMTRALDGAGGDRGFGDDRAQ